jgi:hypothetical protein
MVTVIEVVDSFPDYVPCGVSEVDYEDFMGLFVSANTKIVGFNVAVDDPLVVKKLDEGEHLVEEHEDSFEGEISAGGFKKTPE